MRVSSQFLIVFATIIVLFDPLASAKKSSRSYAAVAPSPSSRRRSSSSSSSSRDGRSTGRVSQSRRSDYEEDDFMEEDDNLDDSEEDEEDSDIFDDDEEDIPPPKISRSRRSTGEKSRPGGSSRASKSPPKNSRPSSYASGPASSSSRKRTPSYGRDRYDVDEEDEYDRPRKGSSKRYPSRGPPQRGYERSNRSSGRSGSVVPYSRSRGPSAFTRGMSSLKNYIPDAAAVREAAAASVLAARETTSALSANVYREVKGLTSSELEQVMLKATRPDDSAIKAKHVERLVGLTYGMPHDCDIYDAVLRKLWQKMSEKDWRTTMKALYILHRFSADGSPMHSHALKAKLRNFRRSRDPKRKCKYFNTKLLLAGDNRAETAKFRAFMSRYAHYVLLRTQCFGGVFDEITEEPRVSKRDKKGPKPITSTCLRKENLEAAALMLKDGVACQLKEGELCENTARPIERVASDLIGLTTAVATALNRVLCKDNLKGADPALIRRWCEFYSEDLLPQTRAMVKKTSSKLDSYGLFLPSRMGASVKPEILQKGLHQEEEQETIIADKDESSTQEITEPDASDSKAASEDKVDSDEEGDDTVDEAEEVEKEVDEYDEYEYEEEYYDEEDIE